MGANDRPGIRFLFANDFNGRCRVKPGIACLSLSTLQMTFVVPAKAGPRLPVMVMGPRFRGDDKRENVDETGLLPQRGLNGAKLVELVRGAIARRSFLRVGDVFFQILDLAREHLAVEIVHRGR